MPLHMQSQRTENLLGSKELMLQHFYHIFFLVLCPFTVLCSWHGGIEEIQVLDPSFWKVTGEWEIFCAWEKLLLIYMDDKPSWILHGHETSNNCHYHVTNWSRPFILHFRRACLWEKGKRGKEEEAIQRCGSNLKSQTMEADGRWQTGRFCEKLE